MDPFTLASLVMGGIQTGMGFTQAVRQNRMKKKAERAADEAIAEARKRLDVNVYDALSLPKEAYVLESEAANVAAAQALEAARESERGVAATAGRVQMAQNQQQQNIRTDMANRLFGIQQQQLAEDQRLKDMGMTLDMIELQGAQQAAADAQAASAAGVQAGMAGVNNTIQAAAPLVDLYQKNAPARQYAKLQKELEAAQAGGLYSGMSVTDFLSSQGIEGFDGVTDPMKIQEIVAGMDANVFKDIRKKLQAGEIVMPINPVGGFNYTPQQQGYQINPQMPYGNIYTDPFGWANQNNYGY